MVWRKKEWQPVLNVTRRLLAVLRRRGHVPMVTGCGERVMVPVTLLRDPCITELLDMAAQRYGYGQSGVLRIPCDVSHFRRVVDSAQRRAG